MSMDVSGCEIGIHSEPLFSRSLESWYRREFISKWPEFRLKKYYSLPRFMDVDRFFMEFRGIGNGE